MKQNQALNDLVKKLNKFDIFYEMSDSHSKISAGESAKQYVQQEIIHLKIPPNKLLKRLDNVGKAVYDRYFKNEHQNSFRT